MPLSLRKSSVVNFLKNAWGGLTAVVTFVAALIGIFVSWHTLFVPESPKSQPTKPQTAASSTKDSGVAAKTHPTEARTLTAAAESDRSFFIRGSENGREEREVAQDLAETLKSKGYRVTNDAEKARCVVDVIRISRENEFRPVNGNNTWFVTVRSEVGETCTTSNNPIKSKITAEGKTSGYEFYDLSEWLLHEAPVALNVGGYAALRISTR